MKNVLEINNLNVFFRAGNTNYQVLNNINLTFNKGEIHSIVGESGCGKSMTALSVMSLLPNNAYIESGKILFRGQNILKLKLDDMRKLRGEKIALIPQDPMTSLNPLYTIENQLLEIFKAHTSLNRKESLKKIYEVLDLVKLPNISANIKSYPYEFSGGMKQRIIIAMALICSPEMIIADEPTTALDVTIQKQIMDILVEIKKEFDTSIMLISHDLALISNYADRVSVMYSGQIVEQAYSDTFFKTPMHPYSQALLNSIPGIDSDMRLKVIEGTPPAITELINGCKFHPRCDFYNNICIDQAPSLREVTPGHFVSCFSSSL